MGDSQFEGTTWMNALTRYDTASTLIWRRILKSFFLSISLYFLKIRYSNCNRYEIENMILDFFVYFHADKYSVTTSYIR